MPAQRYQVTWASDELQLEKQLNTIWESRILAIVWRPAHRESSGEERTSGYVTIWERNRPSEHDQFEYRVWDMVPGDERNGEESLDYHLKIWGLDGWELVTITPMDRKSRRFIFKRKLPIG